MKQGEGVAPSTAGQVPPHLWYLWDAAMHGPLSAGTILSETNDRTIEDDTMEVGDELDDHADVVSVGCRISSLRPCKVCMIPFLKGA